MCVLHMAKSGHATGLIPFVCFHIFFISAHDLPSVDRNCQNRFTNGRLLLSRAVAIRCCLPIAAYRLSLNRGCCLAGAMLIGSYAPIAVCKLLFVRSYASRKLCTDNQWRAEVMHQ